MAIEITVVIPNYNMERYATLAVRSALNQTIKDFDIVVVDDGSTDGSLAQLERLSKEDSRIRIKVHDRNKGASAAHNTGIKVCRTKYVTFLDADDLFSPERLETLCAKLNQGQDPSIVYTDWIRTGPEDTQIRSEPSAARFRPEGMIFKQLLAGSFRFTGGLIALPTECFDQAGLYDESLRWAEDTDMALRLSLTFPFLYERLSTYGWRSHGQSSAHVIGKTDRLQIESRVLEKYIFKNLEKLDSKSKRQAFDRLFGCYIGSGQWARLLRTSITDRQAMGSLLRIPARIT